jgi:hypothetical protein
VEIEEKVSDTVNRVELLWLHKTYLLPLDAGWLFRGKPVESLSKLDIGQIKSPAQVILTATYRANEGCSDLDHVIV